VTGRCDSYRYSSARSSKIKIRTSSPYKAKFALSGDEVQILSCDDPAELWESQHPEFCSYQLSSSPGYRRGPGSLSIESTVAWGHLLPGCPKTPDPTSGLMRFFFFAGVLSCTCKSGASPDPMSGLPIENPVKRLQSPFFFGGVLYYIITTSFKKKKKTYSFKMRNPLEKNLTILL
jgi:hypothetical protein